MSRKALINAFNALAEAAALVAIELEATEQPPAASAPQAAAVSGAGATASASAPVDTQVFTHCPSHGKEFKPSKNPGWGAYCTAQSDDPAWSNDKGYCRITSKNAGEWLAVHGRAAA